MQKSSVISINAPSLLNRAFILLILSFIIGCIFGKFAYAETGYFSELHNAIFAPVVVISGLLLFALAKSYVRYWFIFPPINFFLAGLFIDKSKVLSFDGSGIDDRLVAPMAVFAANLFVLSLVYFFCALTNKEKLSSIAFVVLAFLLIFPFGIKAAADVAYEELFKPRDKMLPNLQGIELTGPDEDFKYIKYSGFFDKKKNTSNYGPAVNTLYVTDSLNIKRIKFSERSSACDNAYDPNSAEKTVAYSHQTTPAGREYGMANLTLYKSKNAGANTTYQGIYYCLYEWPYEYTIEREIPPDENNIPRKSTVEKAYRKYPIEKLIDSFETVKNKTGVKNYKNSFATI